MPTLALDPDLRKRLLEYYLETATGQELSDWLRDINQDWKGSVAEKQERIRKNTKYLSMPAEKFPSQTESYLRVLSSDLLGDLCEDLGLSSDGSRDARYRRIMREVRFREGWFSRPTAGAEWSVGVVKPFIEHYPILKRGKYERDFYDAFQDEMTEVFGSANVHPELAIAYGNTLKIDFHIGAASGKGVGVEWKVPTSNSELQRAIGQLDQYRERYASNLVVVLVPDSISEAQKQLFGAAAASRGIDVVER